MTRILLLGGTSEASTAAHMLAAAGIDAVFSYAGRTANPVSQPLPVRVGGFGGITGLAGWLRDNRITNVIDATHPFAAQMSRNAIDACSALELPLLVFEREPWRAGQGDDWRIVPDMAAAADALPEQPSRIFLAIGRQQVEVFACRAEHHYLLRLVDPPGAPLTLPQSSVVIARGPFTQAGDMALMQAHGITHIVAKNAGGIGAQAKLDAARALGLPVILVDRPSLPPREIARDLEAVRRWLIDHEAAHPARLGV